MKSSLNKRLISAIEQCVPEGQTTAAFLAEILSTGKEAIYRRLRGDVLFSFDEVAKISEAINLSLDNVVGSNNLNHLLVDLSIVKQPNSLENYHQMLMNHTRRVERVCKGNNSCSRMAFNVLPSSFFLQYDNLTRFVLYKWIYQTNKNGEKLLYAQFSLPAKAREWNHKFVSAFRDIRQSSVILDWGVFLTFIKDVEYFIKLNLIEKSDVLVIRNELWALLNELEGLTIAGKYANGNAISIYLSNIEFETPYVHLESETYEFSHIRVFAINGINFEDCDMCRVQKEWIETLKRYSTLITQSGEIQRADYFNTQREYIGNMVVE